MSKILGNIGKVSTILLALSLLVPGGYAGANDDTDAAVRTADVLGLGLVTVEDAVRVDVHTRGLLNTRTSRVDDPDRFVVDVMGAIFRADSTPLEGNGELVLRVRSSQFAFQPTPVARIVVELAEGAEAQLQPTEEGFVILVRAAGDFPAAEAEMPTYLGADDMLGSEQYLQALVPMADEPGSDGWQTAGAPAQDAAQAQPVRLTDTTYARTFSVNTQGADIQTILRSIADFSGQNIITSPRVQGAVTVALTDVPWKEAMDVILRAHGFGYIEENGVFRVDTLEKLREEEIAQKTAIQRVDQIEQLTTKIVRIDFANAEEVSEALREMVSDRGSIEVEPRTNSLVVSDIPSQVEMVAALARELDSRTPQVHINAMLLDLDSSVNRDLGVQWGVSNFKHEGINMAGDFTVNAPLQAPVGQLRVGTVQDWGEVRATIQALERDNKASIVSNPTITTTDNREAEILVGQKIPLIVADEAGNAITQLTTIGIRLIVTPHINSDRQITLDVHPEVSDLSSQATVQGGVIINTSEADTRVVLDNSETAVIAGLIRNVESTLESGVPVLKDIPLVGWLFKSESKAKDQRELIVFITPTVVEDLDNLYDDRQRELKQQVDELPKRSDIGF